MNGIRINKSQHNLGLTILIIVNSIFLLLSVFRVFLCIATLDEAFNVGEAFRVFQGNRYLVENWDYFQTGDSFLTPFLFVFYKITGSTDGIILFSRMVFVVLQLLLSVFMYKILSKYFDRKASIFAVLIYETAVQFLLFYMWYDTWEIYFRLIGLFLIFYVISSFDKMSTRKAFLLVFLAGVSHACMVYAYPTMIIVYLFDAVILFAYKRKQSPRMHNLFLLAYICGAAFVFLIFVVYVLKIGIRNLFVFNDVMLKAGLSSTGRSGYFSSPNLLKNTVYLFTRNFELYGVAMIVYLLDILVLYLLRNSQKRALLFCIIMVAGGLIQLVHGDAGCLTVGFFVTYLSFYVPPLYFLIRKKSDKRAFFKDLIVILMFSSYIAGIAYAFTALDGSLKFACGARTCVIITILLAAELLNQSSSEGSAGKAFGVLATVIVAINILNMYTGSFEGTAPYTCNTRITSGIFKGLIDTPENAKRYETIYQDMKAEVRDTDKTIACGPYAMEFYLMTDLKPNAPNLWDPNNTDLTFKYYETYYGEPDVIVLHDAGDEFTKPEYLAFVAEKYRKTKNTDGYYIYHKK